MSYWNYTFTLNNYTQLEVVFIENLVESNPDDVGYICFGFEEGENGTPHLQGYLELKKKSMNKFSGAPGVGVYYYPPPLARAHPWRTGSSTLY